MFEFIPPHSLVVAGGGFRDSLADIAEELCPVGGEQPVPLPFFIRTLNQVIQAVVCMFTLLMYLPIAVVVPYFQFWGEGNWG